MAIYRVQVTVFLILSVMLTVSPASAAEIWEIQGSGMTSPLVGRRVTTSDNVVFAVSSGGFFMQTPDARSDGNPWTSDGIYVHGGSTAGISVGDLVDVTGTVVEYHGLTELGYDPVVTVKDRAQALAAAVIFDRYTPSPDRPWEDTTLERFEGMRVIVDDGVVSSPTDGYGDAWVTASGDDRLRREPGISWPGVGGLPVWDGNPEAFEISPSSLGLPYVELTGGSRFAAEGALTFSWGDYQLWPTRFDLGPSVELPRPAPPTHSSAIRIATQNLERLGRGLSNNYQVELVKDSLQIVEVLGLPDVVAVQEVEDLETLEELAAVITEMRPQVSYEAILIDGNGYAGIDVGFLVKDSLSVLGVDQVGGEVVFDWDGSQLFDRPPLVLRIGFGHNDLELTIVTVHLRSLRGIEDPSDGPRVRAKRDAQARWMADWIQEWQIYQPDELLMVVGDFNAFEFSDGYVDVMGQITGSPDRLGAMFPATVAVDPALVNTVSMMPEDERYTYVYQGNSQVLDHILVNRAALEMVVDSRAVRGNADVPVDLAEAENTALRSSDHDGLVLTLNPSSARNPGDHGRSGWR